MIDIAQVRKDTPGVQHVNHLNNAGSSLIPKVVHDVVSQYLDEELIAGGYETAAKYAKEHEDFYHSAAKLLNANPDEIAFTQSATDSWTKLFFTLPWKAGDVILTGMAEYASNYIAFLQVRRRYGVKVEVVPNDSSGQLSVVALKTMINPKVKLIALTHIPTNGGLVNPAEAVGEVARNSGVLYLLDACQSLGQYPLDVEKLGAHMLSGTGRKYLRAPRGTGIMYVAREVYKAHEPLLLDMFGAELVDKDRFEMRPDARRFEHFEINFAGKVGMKKAIDYAMDLGMEAIWERVQHLAAYLRTQAEKISGVTAHDLGEVKSGITSLKLPTDDVLGVMQRLRAQHINTSRIVPSGTWLDMEDRQLGEMLRASVHYYNTEEEIDAFCEALTKELSR